jgi:hypothetical protein
MKWKNKAWEGLCLNMLIVLDFFVRHSALTLTFSFSLAARMGYGRRDFGYVWVGGVIGYPHGLVAYPA